jgi:hypothetical protein
MRYYTSGLVPSITGEYYQFSVTADYLLAPRTTPWPLTSVLYLFLKQTEP